MKEIAYRSLPSFCTINWYVIRIQQILLRPAKAIKQVCQCTKFLDTL